MKLISIEVEDLANSENPALRRVATRRDTMRAFEARRNTFIGAERRRSTLRRMSSIHNTGMIKEVSPDNYNYYTNR